MSSTEPRGRHSVNSGKCAEKTARVVPMLQWDKVEKDVGGKRDSRRSAENVSRQLQRDWKNKISVGTDSQEERLVLDFRNSCAFAAPFRSTWQELYR